MLQKRAILGAVMAFALPGLALADAKVYAYQTAANYCPAGLQPVTINGVICCGTPNQHVTYQQAMSHPAPRKKVHKVHHRTARVSQPHCPVGAKGCGFD